MKTFKIECPCCKASLVIDAASGSILSHQEAKREHESLESFLERQKNRSQELDAKLAEARERERQKRELLERKFQAAKENKDLKDPPPGILWD